MSDSYSHYLVRLCALSSDFLKAAHTPGMRLPEKLKQTATNAGVHSVCLLKAISPSIEYEQDESGNTLLDEDRRPINKIDPKRPYPRYVPPKDTNPILRKGGDALVMRVHDQWERREIVVRFALPSGDPEDIAETGEWKPGPRFEKGQAVPKKVSARDYVRDIFRNQINQSKKKKLERKIEDVPSKYTEKDIRRFTRSFDIGSKLSKYALERGLSDWGYIPRHYLFSCAPELWHSMEFIPGETLIGWCQRHSDVQVLELFYKITYFIEQVFHNTGHIHSDLKPSNLLVLDNKPVFLDFGKAKNLINPGIEVTQKGDRGGTPTVTPKEIFDHDAERKFSIDLFQLGRLFHVMYSRSEPDFSNISVTTNEQGIIIDYDESAIKALYPTDSLPLACRYFFEKTENFDYGDIEDLRIDVERALEEARIIGAQTVVSSPTTCSYPCPELRKLIEIVEILLEKKHG